jgi:hypothetical protein
MTRSSERKRPRVYDPATGEPVIGITCPCCLGLVDSKRAERVGKDKVRCPNCGTSLTTEGVRL